MPVVTTSAKGQVVIPKNEREKLGIKPGSKVAVETVNDHIEIHPLPEDPIEYFCGIFKDGPSLTKALLKDRKENLRREEEKIARLIRPSGVSKKRR
ncbi:MAG: AbrB/MazE/SpoVT family DNA-binding domain-containing protein [Nitrospirota bacterium]|nr:AbrB/MazE/SpoVT family DNA-binding domain-containing protein [Nitrospirota bacterium]MDH5767604.1 AbrB/MazE/SpoVT family DNA-binding domain-containing protein [Nitrospirota bacterium]